MKIFLGFSAQMAVILLLVIPATALDGNDILLKVDRNLQPESYEMYRKLINIEPDGSKKEYVLYTVKKGQDKMVALFLSPASEKGRSTLRLGDNMWLYIPSVGKPLRITSLQSVVGGVFNNSDILRLDYSAEYTATIFKETEDTYILDCKAKTPSVAYDSLKMGVDKKAMVPVTIGCYAASGMLIKTLYYKKIRNLAAGWCGHQFLRPTAHCIKDINPLCFMPKSNKKNLPMRCSP